MDTLLKAAFDLDGVLNDFIYTTKDFIEQNKKSIFEEINIEIKNYRIYVNNKDFNPSKEEMKEILINTKPNLTNINWVNKINNLLKKYNKNKKNIIIITAREKEFEDITKNWLDKFFNNYDLIITDKDFKSGYLDNNVVKWAVDDNPFFVADLSKKIENVYLLTNKYNNHYKNFRKNVKKIKTLKTIYYDIFNYLNMLSKL